MKSIVHFVLLVSEISVLMIVNLLIIRSVESKDVVVEPCWLPILAIAVGFGVMVSTIVFRFIGCDSYRKKRLIVTGFVCGFVVAVIGLIFVNPAYPTLLRFHRVFNEEKRWQMMNVIDIHFDAAGGSGCDELRITVQNAVYGEVVNLYPSEDERRMRLSGAKVDLQEGWIVADLMNDMINDTFINYFTSNAVPSRSLIGKWTYVVDFAEINGECDTWYVGQSGPTNWNIYAQLSCGYVRYPTKAGEKQFLVLDSTKWGETCNMLDRACIRLKPGQHLKAKFRVSLFAGTGVNESNYHYVKPGETIACKLPVPTREGYVFEGWYDGDTRVTEETRVEKRETHTLKARWRKL